jgi:hypothetical protein
MGPPSGRGPGVAVYRRRAARVRHPRQPPGRGGLRVDDAAVWRRVPAVWRRAARHGRRRAGGRRDRLAPTPSGSPTALRTCVCTRRWGPRNRRRGAGDLVAVGRAGPRVPRSGRGARPGRRVLSGRRQPRADVSTNDLLEYPVPRAATQTRAPASTAPPGAAHQRADSPRSPRPPACWSAVSTKHRDRGLVHNTVSRLPGAPSQHTVPRSRNPPYIWSREFPTHHVCVTVARGAKGRRPERVCRACH